MAIDPSTRDRIIAMAEDPSGPKSIREIARETGVSRNTIAKILRESLDGEVAQKEVAQKSEPPEGQALAHTRATKSKVAQKKKQVAQKSEPPVEVIETVEITREQTLSDMFSLLQIAKKNLAEAIRTGDDTPQSKNAINGATRAVTEILRELGRWCGLQESIKATAPESKPASTLTLDEALEILRR